MSPRRIVVASAVTALLGATAGSAAGAPGAAESSAPVTAAAAVREVEGTVLSVNRGARTFRLRDVERGTFSIRVTRRTRFERIAGFAGLRRGLSPVEAEIVRSGGRWVAREVEISGGGGRHGGGRED